jgi:hypothetical protein
MAISLDCYQRSERNVGFGSGFQGPNVCPVVKLALSGHCAACGGTAISGTDYTGKRAVPRSANKAAAQ